MLLSAPIRRYRAPGVTGDSNRACIAGLRVHWKTSPMTTSGPARFEIDVPQGALDDLADRLARTRFADDFGNDDWQFGVPGDYLRAIVGHWRDHFDWRAQEAAMNRFANYRVDLDGIPVHFVHEPGRGPAPMPLILTHGWPWTFWDYEHLIGPLSDPVRFGGDAADAFDVIVPSLPGTAFSSPLRTPGIGITATADLWARLMRDVLGYERFAAGGGDSGAFVSVRLGHAYAAHVIGVHLNFPATVTMAALGTISPDDYSTDELEWLTDLQPRDRGTSGPHGRAHRRPSDARVGDERLARRARSLARRTPPQLERLRRRRRTPVQQGPAPHYRVAVLADGDVPHVGPVLRRVLPRTVAARARASTSGRGAHRSRRLPRRAVSRPPSVSWNAR